MKFGRGSDSEPVAGKRRLSEMDAERHLANPELKRRYVGTLFDLISSRYDRFTSWFSFGMDEGWKAELIELLEGSTGAVRCVVDLACGTGDLSLRVAESLKAERVIGIDASAQMLERARQRLETRQAGSIRLCRGDLSDLPVRTGAVDALVIGYGFRNAPDLDTALREAWRVVRPGGTMANLDFQKPSGRIWRVLFLWYLGVAGRLFGRLWHREPDAYGYIARSLRRYLTAEEFSAALVNEGWMLLAVRKKLWGGVCLHLAQKPEDAGAGIQEDRSRVGARERGGDTSALR